MFRVLKKIMMWRELELEIVDVEDNAGKAPLRKSMAVGRILMGS